MFLEEKGGLKSDLPNPEYLSKFLRLSFTLRTDDILSLSPSFEGATEQE